MSPADSVAASHSSSSPSSSSTSSSRSTRSGAIIGADACSTGAARGTTWPCSSSTATSTARTRPAAAAQRRSSAAAKAPRRRRAARGARCRAHAGRAPAARRSPASAPAAPRTPAARDPGERASVGRRQPCAAASSAPPTRTSLLELRLDTLDENVGLERVPFEVGVHVHQLRLHVLPQFHVVLHHLLHARARRAVCERRGRQPAGPRQRWPATLTTSLRRSTPTSSDLR
eukprot:scaffold4090_cov302-Prasinococcus_capsulatus_cf.AAC.4